jgi:hypothetical protein
MTYVVIYMQWRIVMYSDAEMEDVLFPHMLTDEQLDEQYDIEPDCEDPWSEAWMDANALESAGWGEDDGCSGDDW